MRAWWGVLTPGSRALRAVVLVAPALALLLTAVRGPAPRPLLLLLVVVLGGAGALRPESPLLAVAFGLVGFWWALAVRSATPVTAVPAAWLLLGAHVAATLVAYGPPELGLDPALARLWLRRSLLLAPVPAALWLLASAVRDRPGPAGLWMAGLVAAVVVCLVGAAAAFAPGVDREPQSARGMLESQRGRWV